MSLGGDGKSVPSASISVQVCKLAVSTQQKVEALLVQYNSSTLVEKCGDKVQTVTGYGVTCVCDIQKLGTYQLQLQEYINSGGEESKEAALKMLQNSETITQLTKFLAALEQKESGDD